MNASEQCLHGFETCEDCARVFGDKWLGDAEDEVTKLRELMIIHFCDCPKLMLGQLDHSEHIPECRYRKMVS